MSRKNKTISFNAEKINLLTGKEQNFSKYVKRLIEDDMKRVQNGG